MVSDAAKKKAAAKRVAAVTKHSAQKSKQPAVCESGPKIIEATQQLALSDERQYDPPLVRAAYRKGA